MEKPTCESCHYFVKTHMWKDLSKEEEGWMGRCQRHAPHVNPTENADFDFCGEHPHFKFWIEETDPLYKEKSCQE